MGAPITAWYSTRVGILYGRITHDSVPSRTNAPGQLFPSSLGAIARIGVVERVVFSRGLSACPLPGRKLIPAAASYYALVIRASPDFPINPRSKEMATPPPGF
ncbi:uncharacterized protein P884DRAFT_253426, partial [Thermothelomyces heterothallicus CBS 202.75]|uniref:uncharacterized protein n=1 Tax=Thermothelomyces heterothallicus CBS 202.75 TaxID=1149848 RepID=UPI0037439567